MPKVSPMQTTFNGGIQSPLLEGHIDAPRRSSSLADSTNLLPLKHGPAVRRGGTKYVGILREPDINAYLHKFEFSDTESYVLEFSEDPDYGSQFRVYRNHSIVMKTSYQKSITGIIEDGSNDPLITVSEDIPLDGFIPGRTRIYLSGLSEATELNGRWFKVKAVDPLNLREFTIQNYDGSAVGGISNTETSSTGILQRPANQLLPFCSGDMFGSDGSFIPKLVQSNDVIYMVHPDYAPRIIIRTAVDDVWTISIASQDNGPYLSNNTGINMVSPYANGAPSSGFFASGTENNLGGSVSTSKFTMIPADGDAIVNGVTNSNPAEVSTVDPHGFSTGDVIELDGFIGFTWSYGGWGGMTELNGKKSTITYIDSTTFSLNGVDSTNFSVFNYGGDGLQGGGVAYTSGRYVVNMDADVFARSDSTYQVSVNYITKGSTTLVDIKSLPNATEILDGERVVFTGVSGMSIVNNDKYVVGNIGYNQRVISTVSVGASCQVVTAEDHGLSTGNTIYLVGVDDSMVELVEDFYTIFVVASDEFQLVGVNSTGYTPYTSGGTANTTQFNLLEACSPHDDIDSSNYPDEGVGGLVTRGETDRLMQIRFEDRKARARWLWGRITRYINPKQIYWQVDADAKTPSVQWLRNDRGDFKDNKKLPAGPGGRRDSIYVDESGGERYGTIEGGDEWELGAYSDTTGYPSVVTIHQGRVVMGSSKEHPRRLDMTQTGGFNTTSVNFKPFNEDGLVVDSNGISINIGGGDGSGLQWVQSLGGALAVGSTSSEGMVEGGSAGSGAAITPSNAAYRTQATSGSSNVQPIVIGKSLLHIQRTGRRLYELTYQIDTDGYSALDLTELAEHLTRSGIVDFAWQQNPINTLWCVLANGGLIAITYEKNANVIGWHHHTIGGKDTKVNSVAVIPSPDLSHDELWMIVERTVNGATTKTVEYMDRWYEDDIGIRNAYHLDGGLTYSTPDVAITGITSANPAVVTCGTHGLSTGNVVRVDNVVGMSSLNEKYFFITYLTDDTFSLQTLDGIDLDATSYNAFVSGTYQEAKNTFSGLDHLEGETIEILRDGQTHPYLKVCGGIVNLGTTTDKVITGITQATVAVVTSVNHELSNGDMVTINGVTGMTEVNGNCYVVSSKSDDTFELTNTIGKDIDSSLFGEYISDGTVTVSDLNVYGATVHVGLSNSWFMKTLKIEAGAADGTAQSKIKRFNKVFIRLKDTLGFKYGPDSDTLDEEEFNYGTTVSSVPKLYNGDLEVTWNGGYDRTGQIYLKGEGPYPAQIQALMPRLHTQDG